MGASISKAVLKISLGTGGTSFYLSCVTWTNRMQGQTNKGGDHVPEHCISGVAKSIVPNLNPHRDFYRVDRACKVPWV